MLHPSSSLVRYSFMSLNDIAVTGSQKVDSKGLCRADMPMYVSSQHHIGLMQSHKKPIFSWS